MKNKINYLLVIVLLLSSQGVIASEALLEFLESFSRDVRNVYVVEDKIPAILQELKLVSSLVKQQKITSKQALAKTLSDRLSALDKHFQVTIYLPTPKPTDSDSKKLHESYWQKLERKKSGIQKIELLAGNVGYVNLIGFDKVNARSRQRVANAMGYLKGIDTLIMDLRENSGGSPDMVALIAGYFFAKEMPLSSIYNREEDDFIRFETQTIRRKHRLERVQLLLLTSEHSFSAAEAFSYDLQQYGRATVIGEKTGGGANPIRFYQYPQGFEVALPYAMAVNPITKSNWEGVGVTPDIQVKANLAFEKAYCLALLSNQNNVKNPHLAEEIKTAALAKSCTK